jgi:hypothetical protein
MRTQRSPHSPKCGPINVVITLCGGGITVSAGWRFKPALGKLRTAEHRPHWAETRFISVYRQ